MFLQAPSLTLEKVELHSIVNLDWNKGNILECKNVPPMLATLDVDEMW